MTSSLSTRLLLVAVLTLAPVGAVAQPCPGDCDGDGAVRVSELILAVNIALGGAPLTACAALDPSGTGRVEVAQLIAAVGNALCACQACPTPPPTRTRTATPTPPPATPTATPTPTAPPVVSRWTEDKYRLARSTCPRQVNDAVRRELPGLSATYVVTERDGTAEIDVGDGTPVVGSVDADGVLHASGTETQTEGSCTVVIDMTFAVSLRAAQSTGTYDYAVSSSGCPNNLQCAVAITARWQRAAAERADPMSSSTQ